ncbi:MAG TPA: RNA methyltransferase [Smithellaceae bacterium]|nr:RNA methyltransferase [Smithellaceae bacterium]
MLYIALLHYPVYNKEGRIVTTAIANMDIHDIARVARTYGVQGFYIVNPIKKQRQLALSIMNHWQEGYGARFNRSRQAAFALVRVKESLAEVKEEIASAAGSEPRMVVTGANFREGLTTFSQLKEKIRNDRLPYLLIFGTGSGIADEIINRADYLLEPIKGTGNYNHLSVRSAAAIILDRICRD